MNPNNNPNLIRIFVNGQNKNVYDNQSVLQALLQIDENIQHCCHAELNYHINYRYYNCAVKIENHDRQRDFKACLAPIKSGMRILTK